MNTLHAGLMCTLLLVGTIAGLFGCMSAVRCHRRFAFAICLAITLLDFVPLAVLLSNLPTDETLCPILWTAALLLTALSLFASLMLWWKGKRQLSPISIKESCDHLPCALCFAWENGQPCLKNLKLEVLREMTGGDTNHEIAERLHMSVATVKTHILNMLEKTGFKNRTELAVRARESGLVILNRKN